MRHNFIFSHLGKVACIALASLSLHACQTTKNTVEVSAEKMVIPGEFCWNELMTSDPEKAKEFYQALFGWTAKTEEMGGMAYTMFMHGNKPVGGMIKTPDGKQVHSKKHKKANQSMPAHWMSYVAVANIEASVEKAKALGGMVVVPKTNVNDIGSFAIIQDPTGAHIALWHKK